MMPDPLYKTFFNGEEESFGETIENLLPVITKIPDEKSDFSVVGENKENVIIVLKKVINNELSDNEKGFLSKILAAVKLDINNILIISSNSLSYKEIINIYEFDKILISGFSPLDLQMNISATLYKVVRIAEKKMLFVDHLELLESDISKKKLLWNALQAMFDIK